MMTRRKILEASLLRGYLALCFVFVALLGKKLCLLLVNPRSPGVTESDSAKKLSMEGKEKWVPSPMTRALQVLVVALGMGLCPQAWATDETLFSIPQTTADEALQAYARQADRQVLFPHDRVAAYQANAVEGYYHPDRALELLLKGTGLEAAVDNDNLIVRKVQSQGEERNMVSNKSRLGIFGALAAAVMGTGQAQETAGANQPETARQLEEIVVTAQRREENLFDTPVAVTAIDSETLEMQNVSELEDLMTLAPGFQYQEFGTRTNLQMRGIRTEDASPAAENPVALHVDGAYIPFLNGLNGFFFDVNRVEVLQGPQGTLYGRNSAAGALNIITNQPVFQTEGSVEMRYGNYNSKRITGMFNTPITEDIAVRAAMLSSQRDGYFDSGFGDLSENYLRLSAIWNPTDSTSLYVKADGGKVTSKGSGTGIYGVIDSEIQGGLARPVDGDPSTPEFEPVLIEKNDDPFDDSYQHPDVPHYGDTGRLSRDNAQTWGLTAELTQSFDGLDLWVADQGLDVILNVSHREQEEDIVLTNIANTNIRRQGQIETFSTDDTLCFVGPGCKNMGDHSTVAFGERFERGNPDPLAVDIVDLRAEGVGLNGDLNWTLGYFWFRNEIMEPYATSDALTWAEVESFDNRTTTRSWAPYGQFTWDMTDRLSLTAGARSTYDKKSVIFDINIAIPPCGGEACLVQQTTSSTDWSEIDYKLNLAYDLSDDVMLYGTYSTGFRSGNVYPGAFSYYDQETVDAYEVGAKGEFMDERLSIAFNAYYWDYQGLSMNFDTIFLGPDGVLGTPDDDVQPSVGNAGQVEVTGADLEVNYLATENDLFYLLLEYNDAVLEEFSVSGDLLDRAGPNYYVETFDWGGLTRPNAPNWRWTAAWNHTFRFGDGSSLDIRPQVHWEEGRWMSYTVGEDIVMADGRSAEDPIRYPGAYQDDFYEVSISLRYQPANANWYLGAYANNLLDETVWTSREITTVEDPEVPVDRGIYATGQLRAPRTFGVRFGMDF